MSAVKVCILVLLAYNVVDSKFLDYDDGIYDRDWWNIFEGVSTLMTVEPSVRPAKTTRRTKTTTTTEATTTEKLTTTTATPTTEEPESCNSSLYNKHDLVYMIDNIINNSNLIPNITSGFYKNASDLSAKYLQEMEHLYDLIETRPEHFKDILQGIDATRKQVELLIQKMSGSVANYQNNLKDFQKTNDTASQLLQKFEKNNKICELICEKHINTRTIEILRASQPYNPKEYYCGSMSQINDETVASLKAYVEKLHNQLTIKINNDTEFYSEKVNNVSNVLKKYALDKFNRNMYEVIDLQDKYIHLSENISNANIETNINKIRRNVAELNSKLIRFEDAVDNLGKYCRTCNKDSRRSGDDIHAEEIEKFDLLKELIAGKEKEITKEINEKYASIMKPLDDELNHPFKTSFMENLNKTQEAISIETNKQKEEFKNLKDKIDMMPLSEVAQTQQESEDVLKKIERYIQLINEFLKKNSI